MWKLGPKNNLVVIDHCLKLNSTFFLTQPRKNYQEPFRSNKCKIFYRYWTSMIPQPGDVNSLNCPLVQILNKSVCASTNCKGGGSNLEIMLHRDLDSYNSYISDFKTVSTLECCNSFGFGFTLPTHTHFL